MKSIVSKLILTMVVLLLCSCTALPLQVNINISKSIIPVESKYVAVISRLDIQYNELSEATIKSIQNTITAAVYNTGNFEEVYFGELPKHSNKSPTYIEIILIPKHVSSINWWVSWPAVFPMPLYWPVQMKEGTVDFSLNAKLLIEGRKSISIDLKSSHDYSQNIYGFFNERPSEEAFRFTIEELFEKFTQSIQNEFNSELF